MIKNAKQASNTREKLEELKKAKAELLANTEIKETAKYRLGIKSFDGLLKDLEGQLSAYESLVNGKFLCKKPTSLKDISDILISARLAQDLTHKKLGDLLDLKEQQIQRYEATNYETASWPRIVEVAMALNLKFYFEKILILNGKSFDYPDNITPQKVQAASQQVREVGFCLI